MGTRLFRSRDDAMIGGVCAGLGAYLGIDPVWVRLFFLLLALAGNGTGALIYFLLWIVIPLQGERDVSLPHNVRQGSVEIAGQTRAAGQEIRDLTRRPNVQAGLLVGVTLILLGVINLIDQLDLEVLAWLDFELIWPVLLILGGLALLFRRA